ncbi:hypothetical protein DEO72_LG10g1953 [Vigna unguiculata]|uniref:Uncharacterized protein n=1 Tax=Vigna unguiculata TaxID=3917 RepID=A0A4D6NCT6_VIGUN|nr:hypothetical protein DEO72_LG10g1953 [Vigna unguiculata]
MRDVRAGGVLAEVVAILEMVRRCVCHGWNGACAMALVRADGGDGATRMER